MTVLIKDMPLPFFCVTCPMFEADREGEGGFCNVLEKYMNWSEVPIGRRKDCPMVEMIKCRDCVYAVISAEMEHTDGDVTNYYMCEYWHRPTDEWGCCHKAEKGERIHEGAADQ